MLRLRNNIVDMHEYCAISIKLINFYETSFLLIKKILILRGE